MPQTRNARPIAIRQRALARLLDNHSLKLLGSHRCNQSDYLQSLGPAQLNVADFRPVDSHNFPSRSRRFGTISRFGPTQFRQIPDNPGIIAIEHSQPLFGNAAAAPPTLPLTAPESENPASPEMYKFQTGDIVTPGSQRANILIIQKQHPR